ncbi:glycosyl transferase family 2 [Kosakonia sacchari]|uniref:glycosyltransferase family 2 protein n=1 Tax=Kosakonia sacchari TaxID=1158459 RepID=UPI00080753FC|nr:glycosyltransferase family 2 protein [Kosakonia sacchari]ANR80896.1 glycosyl transferase family 2 [Kosakonia sacchari]
MENKPTEKTIAVVIPSYKVKKHILDVLNKFDSSVSAIYIVDDCCPEKTGDYVIKNCHDSRVKVLRHDNNKGVGGAVLTGYKQAMLDGHYCAVKVDGDGQMDPSILHHFTDPIVMNKADYTKGNRFYNPEDVKAMPTVRLIGNLALSFMQKISSGYWDLFDPTNGYTAINLNVLKLLNVNKIEERYFFESDILFRLGTINAVVIDIPMKSIYADEISNLKISDILFKFMKNHLKNTIKRIFYKYYLRDFSVASIQLPLSFILIIFGLVFGGTQWYDSIASNSTASSGTVMLASMPIIIGVQLFLSFLSYDMHTQPTRPLSEKLE